MGNFINEVYADSNMENPPDFVYADVHGNLKLKMSKKTKKGFFFNFNSIEQLRFLINVNQEYLDRPPVKDRANEADDDDMGFGAFCWTLGLGIHLVFSGRKFFISQFCVS